MPGYALLPTLEAPTSTMTFRLSKDEMDERNEWIRGAFARDMPIAEIAYEVGLSEPRVYQILKPSRTKTKQKGQIALRKFKTPRTKTKQKGQIALRKFKTPRDAAVAEFLADSHHIMGGGGTCRKFDHECMHCTGSLMMVEFEYDADGWPYSWAMYGQEKYIAMCS